jgi:hypothetical protein
LVTNSSTTLFTVDVNFDGAGILNLGNAEGDKAVIQSTDFLYLESPVVMAEDTTPTAIPNYGRIYPKSDNQLYFQDGAGVEHVVTLAGSDYGEMGNIYGSSATEAIADANEWYACYHANITGSAPHLNSGFTFTAGQVGVIGAVSDAGTGDVWIVDAGCNLTAGDYVTINSCADANYNGVFEVKSVDVDSFTVTTTWGATDTGAWQEGSYLECNTTGNYRGVWTATITQSDAAARTTIVTPFLNAVQATKATALSRLANTSDQTHLGGNGLMLFTVGDRIWFAVQTSDPQTITFTVRNMSVH